MLVLLALLALVAAGCGNSPDPESWEQAEEEGLVRANFMESCQLANEGAGEGLTTAQARQLCECTYEGLRNALTFDQFRALDRALRDDPNPSDLDGEPEDSWDDEAERIIRGCIPRSAR